MLSSISEVTPSDLDQTTDQSQQKHPFREETVSIALSEIYLTEGSRTEENMKSVCIRENLSTTDSKSKADTLSFLRAQKCDAESKLKKRLSGVLQVPTKEMDTRRGETERINAVIPPTVSIPSIDEAQHQEPFHMDKPEDIERMSFEVIPLNTIGECSELDRFRDRRGSESKVDKDTVIQDPYRKSVVNDSLKLRLVNRLSELLVKPIVSKFGVREINQPVEKNHSRQAVRNKALSQCEEGILEKHSPQSTNSQNKPPVDAEIGQSLEDGDHVIDALAHHTRKAGESSRKPSSKKLLYNPERAKASHHPRKDTSSPKTIPGPQKSSKPAVLDPLLYNPEQVQPPRHRKKDAASAKEPITNAERAASNEEEWLSSRVSVSKAPKGPCTLRDCSIIAS